MSESGFLIFFILFLFFSEILAQFDYERNSGIKFFFLFLGLSHPVLAKNNAGKRFFSFFKFFAIFFRKFLPRAEYEWNSGQIFFFTFSAYLIPFWLKIMPGRGFIIF